MPDTGSSQILIVTFTNQVHYFADSVRTFPSIVSIAANTMPPHLGL